MASETRFLQIFGYKILSLNFVQNDRRTFGVLDFFRFLKVWRSFVIIELKEGEHNDFTILCNGIYYRKPNEYRD